MSGKESWDRLPACHELVWDRLPACHEFTDEPLHKAIREGDVARVAEMLASGHDPNVENYNGLLPLSAVAAQSGNIEIAQLLLDAGANPNGS